MAKAKKAASEKSSGTKKPIADVAHPGTTAPSDTSKPIITQRPMIKDPMMVEDGKPEEAAAQKPLTKKSSEIKVAPLEEPAADDDKTAAAPPEDEAEKAAQKDSKPEEATGAGSDDGKDDAETKDEAADKKPDKPEGAPSAGTEDAEAAEEAAKEAKLQQLIDSKKYFLPINAVEQRRSKRVVIIGAVLALILVAAWVDIALDAGLIHLGGVKPLTHFFSN